MHVSRTDLPEHEGASDRVTGPVDGSPDLCPQCGGLTLEILMREAEGEAESDQREPTTEHCQHCGRPTLLSLLSAELAAERKFVRTPT